MNKYCAISHRKYLNYIWKCSQRKKKYSHTLLPISIHLLSLWCLKLSRKDLLIQFNILSSGFKIINHKKNPIKTQILILVMRMIKCLLMLRHLWRIKPKLERGVDLEFLKKSLGISIEKKKFNIEKFKKLKMLKYWLWDFLVHPFFSPTSILPKWPQLWMRWQKDLWQRIRLWLRKGIEEILFSLLLKDSLIAINISMESKNT